MVWLDVFRRRTSRRMSLQNHCHPKGCTTVRPQFAKVCCYVIVQSQRYKLESQNRRNDELHLIQHLLNLLDVCVAMIVVDVK